MAPWQVKVSDESNTEAAWRGFFTATIDAGLGTVIGMITGFIVGSLADSVISAATGEQQQVHYGYLLAEAGTYVGLVLGLAVGIVAGASSAARKGRRTRIAL